MAILLTHLTLMCDNNTILYPFNLHVALEQHGFIVTSTAVITGHSKVISFIRVSEEQKRAHYCAHCNSIMVTYLHIYTIYKYR